MPAPTAGQISPHRTAPIYLTIAEAAEFLRCRPKTVHNKMSAGVFRLGVHYFKRRGSKPLFKREALEAYVEAGPAPSRPNPYTTGESDQ
jgi:excisionase family DNA binding protein